MHSTKGQPQWLRELKVRFRTRVAELVATVPASVVSLSLRRAAAGPLEPLLTVSINGEPVEAASPLDLGAAAVDWLETNRRELVLEVRPRHSTSELYRPLVERGIVSAVVVPVFRASDLVGSVAVGSARPTAYSERHVKLMEMMAADLAPYFPRPGAAESGKPPKAEKPAAAEPAPAAGEAFLEADRLGRIAAWNDVAERLFGWSGREVVGNYLTLFYRKKHRRLLDPTLRDELLKGGVFRGRGLCYSREGLPVTCEMEMTELRGPNGSVRGFRGRFRSVAPITLLPREEIEFAFAQLYAFTNPVCPPK
jgi:PAS domain S-box-containing protein